jgi:DNA polymerase III sliding clamp (beta) subunit (PCNA family)
MIPRQRLLRKLQQVLPAVATHDLVPCFTHVLLSGSRLVAYDDEIAISVPLCSEFTGTIPGQMLFDLLKLSHSSTVEMAADGNGVVLNATDFLEMGAARDYHFEMPPLPAHDKLIPVGGEFFAAVEKCLDSVCEHAVLPDHLGITLIPGDRNQLKMFTTDMVSMTHCTIELPKRLVRKRVIVPKSFCKQMLRLARQAQTTRIALRNDQALFVADDALLFGRLVQSKRPLNFEEVLGQMMPNGTREKMVPIPKPKLGLMLQRAARVCGIKGNKVKTKIIVRKQVIAFASASRRGEVFETAPLPGHPDIEALLHATYLLKPYRWAEQVLITDKCMSMAAGNTVGMVACYQN